MSTPSIETLIPYLNRSGSSTSTRAGSPRRPPSVSVYPRGGPTPRGGWRPADGARPASRLGGVAGATCSIRRALKPRSSIASGRRVGPKPGLRAGARLCHQRLAGSPTGSNGTMGCGPRWWCRPSTPSQPHGKSIGSADTQASCRCSCRCGRSSLYGNRVWHPMFEAMVRHGLVAGSTTEVSRTDHRRRPAGRRGSSGGTRRRHASCGLDQLTSLICEGPI